MGETDVETMGNVTVAKYDFDDEAFNDISEEALNFIAQLLLKEPEKRMTATETLQHSWLSRRQQQPPATSRPPLTTSSMAMPQVELISDLSPPNTPPLDTDEMTSTLSSDVDNSESDYVVDRPPPPLPKTAPPPIELLIESSLPIIFPTSTEHESMATGEAQRTTTAAAAAVAELSTELVIKTQSLAAFRSLA